MVSAKIAIVVICLEVLVAILNLCFSFIPPFKIILTHFFPYSIMFHRSTFIIDGNWKGEDRYFYCYLFYPHRLYALIWNEAFEKEFNR